MDNDELLLRRWSNTDDSLKKYLKDYNKINSRIQDKIQSVFDSIDFTYLDLNKTISTKQRKKLLRIIEEWEEKGLLNGYFRYKVQELIKKINITNDEMFNILLWGAFIEKRELLNKKEKTLFTEVGQDLYIQGFKELKPKKKSDLTWDFILIWLSMPNTYGSTWTDYIEALALTEAQEIQREAKFHLQQNKKLDITDDVFQNIVSKQQNRYLSINGDKYSGALDSEVREIANRALVKAGEDTGDKKLKARFIAEIDNRTTEMCLSMDNMLFNVNDWNTFQRYSAGDGRIVDYKVKGLVLGINLPPINNHFHYCRSTITYLIDMPREELNKNLQTTNEKQAINKWLSSDFYNINRKMYNDIKLSRDEKKLVKDLYRALNKQKNYIAKDDEYIVRVLDIDTNELDKVINNYPVNKIYKSKSFESYSLRDDYNPDANVFLYVKGSKKAKNMLEYNPKEAEVLYPYGTKFITKTHYIANGKHYFLLEEL